MKWFCTLLAASVLWMASVAYIGLFHDDLNSRLFLINVQAPAVQFALLCWSVRAWFKIRSRSVLVMCSAYTVATFYGLLWAVPRTAVYLSNSDKSLADIEATHPLFTSSDNINTGYIIVSGAAFIVILTTLITKDNGDSN